MKTFNRKNTDDIKQAKKASKQLRKLRMQHGSLMFEHIEDKLVGQRNSYSCDYQDDYVHNYEYEEI